MSIEERVERLERANRRLQLGFGGVSALLVAALLSGAASQGAQDEIRTRAIHLYDSKGKVRGMIGTSITGEKASLTLLDETGKERLSLTADNEGAGIYLSDASKLRASLSTFKGLARKDPTLGMVHLGEGAFLTLRDRKGEPRVNVDVSEDAPWLTLKDENGKGRATIGIGALSGALLRLSAPDSGWMELGVVPGQDDGTGPQIHMKGKDGQRVLNIPGQPPK